MNTPVKESTFVKGLSDLAHTLRLREDEGLTRLVEPDTPTLLQEIAEQLNDGNVEELCTRITEIISNIGTVHGGMMIEDDENLNAIAYHLGTMLNNPLREEGDTYSHLGWTLKLKIQLIEQKAEAFSRYIGR